MTGVFLMNMQGTKDGCLGWLFLLALVWDVQGFIITMDSASKLVNDDNFTVSCRDNDTGLPVTWRSPKGAILGEKTRPKVEQQSFGTLLIFISPHKVEDSGNYTCSTEKEKRVFQLFVNTPLKFSDTSPVQTGEEGKDYVIKCEVKGGTVAWFNEGGGIIETNKKYTILGDGLAVKNVTRHDNRTYVCKGLQQKTGTFIERKIHFIVKHKPVHPSITHERVEIVYGYIKGTVNLTCLAVANPPANFSWRVNDTSRKVGQIINESPEVSILQLHIDNDAAFGNYKCIAKNKYGRYEQNFMLKKEAKPVEPREFRVKEIGINSITLEIVGPEMNTETKGFSVQYKKIDDKEWKQMEFNITTNDLYVLNNLDSKTEYEVQTATRNLAGLSDYLSPQRATTSSAASLHVTLSVIYSIGAVILLGNFNLAFW